MTDATDIIDFLHLHECDSTQQIALQRLEHLAPNRWCLVLADSQSAGQGREDRSWEQPPGRALLASIAAQGPWHRDVLIELPQRVAQLTLAAIEALHSMQHGQVSWKAPNDLVAGAASGQAGAKLGGVLIDAATTASSVSHLVIGIGINLTGGAFRTGDGRMAIALDTLVDDPVWFNADAPALAQRVTRDLQQLLSAPR